MINIQHGLSKDLCLHVWREHQVTRLQTNLVSRLSKDIYLV
nr:MAG TPA: hypothetical protein [Caudoviricetes sp.]